MNATLGRRIAAVERYIHDLAIALADIPVDEREDVIAGVRDHIEDALDGFDDPAPEEVERVLTSLGDPAEIAADARGRSGAPGTGQEPRAAATEPSIPPAGTAPSAQRDASAGRGARSLLERERTPIGVMGLFVLAAFATWFLGPGALGLGVLFWLGGLVALVASPLWSAAEKVVGTLWFGVGPILAGLSGIVLGLFYVPGPRAFVAERFGSAIGPIRDSFGYGDMGGLAVAGLGLVGLAGTVVIMAWLVSAGTKRARQVADG